MYKYLQLCCHRRSDPFLPDLFYYRLKNGFGKVERLRKVETVVYSEENYFWGKLRMQLRLNNVNVILLHGSIVCVNICITSFSFKWKTDHERFRHNCWSAGANNNDDRVLKVMICPVNH
jgi:hypothetical protein